MAYMKERERQDGRKSYVVGWTDSAGRECQRTYRDKAQANRLLKERIAQEVRDELPDESQARQPFERVALSWLAATRRKVKARTADGYEELLKAHVLPAFGSRRIGAITTQDVDEWLGELMDRRLTPKTVRNIYTPLASTFRYAVKVKVLRSSPCAGVDLPEARDEAPFEGLALERPQVEALAEDMTSRWAPYGLAALTLANTGLRAAEFAGLRLSDLDCSGGVVLVRRTLARDRRTREWTVGTTKSRRNREAPVLDDAVLDALAEYVDGHPRRKERDAPLFYGRADGGHAGDPAKPFDPHVFYQWHFKPAA